MPLHNFRLSTAISRLEADSKIAFSAKSAPPQEIAYLMDWWWITQISPLQTIHACPPTAIN